MWNTFSGHNLHMQWSYGEANPISGATGSWESSLERILGVCLREGTISQPGVVHLGSAVSLPFEAESFDAVIIDPPYADNVPYADLSDFFYVWLRRTVGDLYPEAFQCTLTPKDEEAVVNPARFGGGKKGEQIAQAHYQRLMQKSFEEIYRVLKPEGMAVNGSSKVCLMLGFTRRHRFLSTPRWSHPPTSVARALSRARF
jgi:adenine-specific DNA methylase